MAWTVIWTRPAEDDLDAILESTAARSRQAARKLRDQITDTTARLADHPGLGAGYEVDPDANAREVLSGQHRIFYRLFEDDERVEIICVRHGSRGEPRLPS